MASDYDAAKSAEAYLFPTWEPDRAREMLPGLARLLRAAYEAGAREERSKHAKVRDSCTGCGGTIYHTLVCSDCREGIDTDPGEEPTP